MMSFMYIYRKCVWHKHVKVTQHQYHLLENKSEPNCDVNVTHARYFLLEFKGDTVDFADAVAVDDI